MTMLGPLDPDVLFSCVWGGVWSHNLNCFVSYHLNEVRFFTATYIVNFILVPGQRSGVS